MLRAIYVALLNREPEPEARSTYGAHLKEHADLPGLIRSVAQSQEHWASLLETRAEELVQGIGQHLSTSEADEPVLSACVTELRQSKSLAQLLSTLARSPAYWERILELRARELARAACESLLGREPDEQTLDEYASQLRQHRDLSRLLATVAESDGHWERLLSLRAEELVGTVYEGLLSRQPEGAALSEYGTQLKQGKDLAALLSTVAESDEHWERLLALKAEELVREVYRGLLKREPDQEALAAYSAQFRHGGRLAGLLTGVAESDEHWRNLLGLKAKEVVAAVYRGLLKREPDEKGLTSHMDGFGLHRDLTSLVSVVRESAEYREFLAKERAWPHPKRTYGRKTLVFLHIEKTGGTSLQNMLRDTFAEQFYGEHRDTLQDDGGMLAHGAHSNGAARACAPPCATA